jgi:hypothetical protein
MDVAFGQSQAGLVEGIFRCKVILEYSGRTVHFNLTIFAIDFNMRKGTE